MDEDEEKQHLSLVVLICCGRKERMKELRLNCGKNEITLCIIEEGRGGKYEGRREKERENENENHMGD